MKPLIGILTAAALLGCFVIIFLQANINRTQTEIIAAKDTTVSLLQQHNRAQQSQIERTLDLLEKQGLVLKEQDSLLTFVVHKYKF